VLGVCLRTAGFALDPGAIERHAAVFEVPKMDFILVKVIEFLFADAIMISWSYRMPLFCIVLNPHLQFGGIGSQ
jgi:hypothetical protein